MTHPTEKSLIPSTLLTAVVVTSVSYVLYLSDPDIRLVI
jgi:hypothetical protein